MIGHLTFHNLYKVKLNFPINSLQTISSRAMTAGISKSATNLFTWHQSFAYLNKAYIKHLVNITSGMVINPSSNTLSFCSTCVKAKMIR